MKQMFRCPTPKSQSSYNTPRGTKWNFVKLSSGQNLKRIQNTLHAQVEEILKSKEKFYIDQIKTLENRLCMMEQKLNRFKQIIKQCNSVKGSNRNDSIFNMKSVNKKSKISILNAHFLQYSTVEANQESQKSK